MRTVDEAGQPIDALTLSTTADAIASTGSAWKGGAFGIASVQQGTDSKVGQAGWITVPWPNPVVAGVWGESDVGRDGGSILRNYLDPLCNCNGSKMRPRFTRHELGHAFGFFHTGEASDLMSGLSCPDCQPDPPLNPPGYVSIVSTDDDD